MLYYFTFGADDGGGWVEVSAPNIDLAAKAFTIVYPQRAGGLIACAGIYSEEEFRRTSMYYLGNFRRGCRVKITFDIKIVEDAHE